MQVSTQRLLQTAFFDVEQIDVLKGPQSLYFGKAASAGVLSLRSANPTKNWEYSGQGSYEFEERGYTIGGYISGPLSNNLGIRVAAQYQDISNYVQLEPQAVARDRNKGIKNFIGRVTLQWDPVDNFSANFKFNYNVQRSETILGHSDLGCVGGPPPANTSSVFGGSFVSSHSCNVNDGLYPFSDGDPLLNKVFAGSTGDGRDLSQEYNDTDLIFARLNLEWKLNDKLTLVSRTGYIDLFNEYNGNFTYTGTLGRPVGLVAPFRNELTQFTQEVRLLTKFDGKVNFMLGGFYENRDIPYGTSQNAFAAGLARPSNPGGERFDWYAERNSKANALSFFGSATIDFTDQLQLSGGLRWTNENKSTTISFPFVHDLVSTVFGFVSSGFQTGPIKFSDSNLSPEVTLRYKATDDVNLYAAFKTGFKSGGVDNNALPSAALRNLNSPDPAVRAAAERPLIFRSERSQGGEIGIKTQLADRTITLNAVAFYYSFKDLQIQEFSVAIFNFETYNASKVVTQGIDVDWAWKTPVKGLSLSGAASYTDTRYKEDIVRPNLSVAIVNGRSTARAPRFSGNVAFDWKTRMSDALELGLGGNLSYSDSYWTNPVDTIYRQRSFVTFDSTISIGALDRKWSLALIGTNLTNKLWTNTEGAAPFTPGSRVHTQNRGRQVFLQAGFKF